MNTSILDSTKKVLGVADDYTAFDLDIITFINSAFSDLNQLGIGPVDGFAIEDATAVWADFDSTLPTKQLNWVKTYVFLRSRMLFDPPTIGYLIDAMNKQLDELVWRMSVNREETVTFVYPEEDVG